jgi:hypothetical protein
MPGAADEAGGDGFSDVDAAVWKDANVGFESFDAEFFGNSSRGKR